MPHKAGIGAIKGITSEDGVAAQKRVVLLDRSNMAVVSQQTAASDGSYAFTGLNADTTDYLIFAVDDDGSPKKNPIIYDYVQPIPAYQGATFMGNYRNNVMSLDPCAVWFGDTDSSSAGLTPSGIPIYTGGGTPSYNQANACPGAPNIPMTSITNTGFGVPPRQGYPYGQSVTKVSLEMFIRRDSLSGSTGAGVLLICSQNITSNLLTDDVNAQVFAQILYYHNTQKLIVYINNGTSGSYMGNLASINGAGLDMSSYPNDVHIIATIEFANQLKIYINGNLVNTTSLSGGNAQRAIGSRVYFEGLAFCGSNQNSGTYLPLGRYTTALFGPLACYDGILTQAQITSLYNDLMVGTSPAITGYAKEVTLDNPLFYYRLGEANGDNGFIDQLSQTAQRALTIVNKTNIAYSQSSPVVGRTAVKFTASKPAAARGNGVVTHSASIRELSFGFIAEHTLSTPAANEVIYALTRDDEIAYAQVYRGTDGKYRFSIFEYGSQVTYTFSTVIAANVRNVVVITMNKANANAKLYLNGALVETITVTATVMNLWQYNAAYTKECHIGGSVSDANGISNPLSAYLSEVFFCSQELTASRVLAQYNALTTL